MAPFYKRSTGDLGARRWLVFGLLTLLTGITACTSIVGRSGPSPAYIDSQKLADDLAARMIGVWKTADNDPDNNFTDQRIPMEPLAEGRWVYYQLNTGIENKLYRQRVLQLINGHDGSVSQTTWSLRAPDLFATAATRGQALASLSSADLEPSLEPGCEMVWRKMPDQPVETWVGIVDSKSCKIFSERRQAEIYIYGESRLTEKAFWHTEKGFDAAGKQLFGSENGSFIILDRQKP